MQNQEEYASSGEFSASLGKEIFDAKKTLPGNWNDDDAKVIQTISPEHGNIMKIIRNIVEGKRSGGVEDRNLKVLSSGGPAGFQSWF